MVRLLFFSMRVGLPIQSPLRHTLSSTRHRRFHSHRKQFSVTAVAASLSMVVLATYDGTRRTSNQLDSARVSAPLLELEREAEVRSSSGASPSPSSLSESKPSTRLDPSALPSLSEAHLHPIPSEVLNYVDPRPFRHMALGTLLSRYAVFTLCGIPPLIDRAPALMNWALDESSLPGVKPLTEWVVRQTFFKQFVGSESAQGCLPLLAQLSRDNLAALFAFSVEMIEKKGKRVEDLDQFRKDQRSGKQEQQANVPSEVTDQGKGSKYIYDSIIDDLLESIRVGAEFAARPSWADSTSTQEAEALAARPSRDGSTMVAIKLSGLLRDPSVLMRASAVIVPRERFSAGGPEPLTPLPLVAGEGKSAVDAHHGAQLAFPVGALSTQDVEALKELWQGMRKLALYAQRAGSAVTPATTASPIESKSGGSKVRLVVDAEYSWFQPAIDALYEALAQEFNRIPPQATSTSSWTGYHDSLSALTQRLWGRRLSSSSSVQDSNSATVTTPSSVPGPLLFNTYQAYLRRTPSYLAASLARARAHGYTLGVKLVRGAYVEIENAQWADTQVKPPPPSTNAERDVRRERIAANAAAIAKADGKNEKQIAEAALLATKKMKPLDQREQEEWHSPVWRNKTLTDRCYDGCAVRLIDEIAAEMQSNGSHAWPRLSVIFATHNWQSTMKVTRRMVQRGLASPPDEERLQAKQFELEPFHGRALGDDVQGEKQTGEPQLVLLQVAPGVRGRVMFGQLLGMADSLTRRIQLAFDPSSGGVGPHMCLKYVPYGPLHLVMPYLVRRSVENKTVMRGSGGSTYERKLAGREIRKRLFPFLS